MQTSLLPPAEAAPAASPVASAAARASDRSLQRPQRLSPLSCLARHISRVTAYDRLGHRYVYFVPTSVPSCIMYRHAGRDV